MPARPKTDPEDAYKVYSLYRLKHPKALERDALDHVAEKYHVSRRQIERLKEKHEWANRFAEERKQEREKELEAVMADRKLTWKNMTTGAKGLTDSFNLRAVGICHRCRGTGQRRTNASGPNGPLHKCAFCDGTGDYDNSKVSVGELRALIDLNVSLWGSNPMQEEEGTTEMPWEEWRREQASVLQRAGLPDHPSKLGKPPEKKASDDEAEL